MLRKATPEALDMMRRTCGSANLRHAERLVTGYYDRALKSTGITATQLPLLSAIGYGEVQSISALADVLHLERTTVSRELSAMKRRKLVATASGTDRRVTTLALTPAGRTALTNAHKAWQRAHAKLLAEYGDDAFDSFLTTMRELGRAVKSISGAPQARKRR